MKQATHSDSTANQEYLEEPDQPRLEDPIPNMTTCRVYRGVKYFPPVLPEAGNELDILFVQLAPMQEEASGIETSPHGLNFKRAAGLGTGPASQIIRDSVDRFPELSRTRIGFASAVPWLLPKTARFKPKKEVLEKVKPWIRQQVAAAKPKVVVALGMPAFKLLCDLKIGHDDARYGWFSTGEGNIPLYLSFPSYQLVSQPWQQDTLLTDLKEVDRFLRTAEKSPQGDIKEWVINTYEELEELVKYWQENDFKEFSVDCEWGRGMHHLIADLRSIQFAWSKTEGAYLRFYDEHNTRFLGHIEGTDTTDYKRVGEILNKHFDRPDIEFIGHHFTADSPWMDVSLGIEVLGKCAFDSEYALQTIDEYSPRGLEVIALKYTDLGRYDMDLVMWKKANPGATKDGYEKVPDDILIPYAIKDVIVVFRSRESIERRMKMDDVYHYYKSILNPFVTDVFHTFVVEGLPVNMELFEAVRKFMNWAYRVLTEDLLEALARQADSIAAKEFGLEPSQATALRLKFQELGRHVAVSQLFALYRGNNDLADQPWFNHWLEVHKFNLRSSVMMARWLFDVCGFTPVKTTKGGGEGAVPQMLWEKAMELPEKLRKLVKPATDKETLEILEKDDESGLITRLLAVSNVGNQCKGFLKEGDIDEATGEVVQENGLAKFIAPDLRIHGQFSLTETGRPRSWSPNILNLSAYHNKGVEAGLIRALNQRPDLEIPEECASVLGTRDEIEQEVKSYYDIAQELLAKGEIEPAAAEMSAARKEALKNLVRKRVPTVRSIVCAEEGWCFVESDYATAEIRGLAFIFGDRTLIRLMTEPDPSHAFTKDGQKVRLYYADDCGIKPNRQNPDWIMKIVVEGEILKELTEDDLMRDDQGNIVHPPYDLHWSLAEWVYEIPREELNEKIDRGAGKVGNFCIAEGELVLTRSGLKPIERVLGCDLLWDGVEWVSHEGVVYSGTKEVIEYQGLWATKLHEVWTKEEGKIRLGEASAQSLELVRSEEACSGYHDTEPADLSGYNSEERVRVLSRLDALRAMRRREGEGAPEHGEGLLFEVPVSAADGCDRLVSGNAAGCGVLSWSPVSSYGTALREGYARLVRKVQGAWDHCRVRVQKGLRNLGFGDLAWGVVQGNGLRQDRQRRSLLEGEPAAGGSNDQPTQPRGCSREGSHRARQGVLGEASGGEVHGANGAGLAEVRAQGSGDPGPSRCEQPSRVAKTYDILNAGPRNRFTCQGVLVSNSAAYGAVASTLERRIEASTGVKPEEGTGEKILAALEKRQPDVVRGLDEVAEKPKHGESMRAASGRVRRFPTHSSSLRGVSWRTRKSIERSMGNEARNFFPQESVAATLARACHWLNCWYRAEGLKARAIVGLYDSVVTYCPLEERHVCAEAHEVYMHRINFWKYGQRYMNYPIDTDLVERWSYKPPKELKAKLEDPDYRVMDKEKAEGIMTRLRQREEAVFNAQPWVKKNLNKAEITLD